MSAMRTLALFAAALGVAQASAVIPNRNDGNPILAPRGESPLYGQCGGEQWSGTTNCVAGATCWQKNAYYFQCIPATSSAAAPAAPSAQSGGSGGGGGGGGSVPLYGQCGAGKGAWTGPTACAQGSCQAIQEYYSQCLPAGAGAASAGSSDSNGIAASDANATQKPTIGGGGGGGGSVPLYGQCGAGKGTWSGPTSCASGTCQAIQEYYSQCLPDGSSDAASAPAASAPAASGGGSVPLYGQCGAGKGTWSGPTSCASGTCQAIQEYYSQCLPGGSSDTAAAPAAAPAASGGGSVPLYGQCGAGKGTWTGPTTCASGTCQAIQEYYSQCLPGTASSSSDATGTTPAGPSQSLWGQCGGNNYNGPTTCPSGAECDAKDDTYSQCLPSGPKASLYQQCGGGTWSGPTVCVVGASCKQLNQWYSQCFPASKKREAPVFSKRDLFQEIVKAIGFDINTPSAEATLVNDTSATANVPGVLPPSAVSRIAAPVSSLPPKPTVAKMYGQCGGIGFKGATICPEGFVCTMQGNNAYYSQCLPGNLPASVNADTPVVQAPFAQCGGLGFTGSTMCAAGTICTAQVGNIYFSQCLPTAQLVSAVPASSSATVAAASDAVAAPIQNATSVSVPISAHSTSEVAKRDVAPAAAVYAQCGGTGWIGSTTCEQGSTCVAQPNNPFYSQCMPTLTETTQVNGMDVATVVVPFYGQCGGQGWTGPTKCAQDSTCVPQANNSFYAQCIPSFAAPSRRGLINAQTSVVFNPPQNGETGDAAPAAQPEQFDVPPQSVSSPSPSAASPDDTPISGGGTATSASAPTQTLYGQCGGSGYTGPSQCEAGSRCYEQQNGNAYSQCLPLVQQVYGQCGGNGYSGPSTCEQGSLCSLIRIGYSQCVPFNLRRDGHVHKERHRVSNASAPAPHSTAPGNGSYIVNATAMPTFETVVVRTHVSSTAASQTSPAPESQPPVQIAQPAVTPVSEPQIAQQTPMATTAAPALQTQLQVAPPASVVAAPPEIKDTTIPYNPALDSLLKTVPSMFGATAKVYATCGGYNYQGNTICEAGSKCYTQNAYFSQCLPLVVAMYQQCGGGSYFGSSECVSGGQCQELRPDYFQCVPSSAKARRGDDPLQTLGSSLIKTSGMYGQCGGTGWTGPKLCQPGAKCVASGSAYSQCLPDNSPFGKLADDLTKPPSLPKLALPDLDLLAPAAAPAPAAGGAAPAAAAAAKPAR